MFERYTERARQVIFFGRYEASQFGSPYIETEHLLLGLLREDKALASRFMRSHVSVESIRKQIAGNTTIREKISTSIDLPLSNECKRVLAYAAEEAERLSHKHIGTEHLLLGLLREETCFAADILHERGLRLPAVREEIQRATYEKLPAAQQPKRNRETSLLAQFSRDLTEAATRNLLEPVIGFDNAVDALLEVLCSRANRNPLLICASGVDGRSMVELLAQMISDGEVPPSLQDKQLLALDLEQMVEADTKLSNERLASVLKELIENKDFIVSIDEIHRLSELDPLGRVRRALANGEIQCIGTTTPDDHARAIRNTPSLSRCFRNVRVGPMSEDDVIRSLFARKPGLEQFHAVSYSDEAIRRAVQCAAQYFPNEPVFEKAMEIIDLAGTREKLRQTSLPEELAGVQKRIKFIVHRTENAIANHEFEKARFYSDEERKERENLKSLRVKYGLDDSAVGLVTETGIEDVVRRWTGYSVSSNRGGLKAEEGHVASAPRNETQRSHKKSLGLSVFMCHASNDKSAVHNLYKQLRQAGIEPWLDSEDLIGGQEWRYEIEKAVRASQVVLVCLSKQSVSKTGFVHREIKIALDVADNQPEGTIFVIPLKLEECEVPDRLKQWQWVDLYIEKGFERLMRALTERGRSLAVDSTDEKANS